MKPLTLRQHEILGFIRLHFQEKAYWPSIRDIQSHFGFSSTNAVVGHLRALEKKGVISRVSGQARAYRVVAAREDERPQEAVEVVDIPVYGRIAAGFPQGAVCQEDLGKIQVDLSTLGGRRPRRAFALKVHGDSMIDAGIHEGDMVVVEPGVPKNGDIVAALIDGETTLKRFIQKPGITPYLKAENIRYPKFYPLTELVIQGIAKAVVRSLG